MTHFALVTVAALTLMSCGSSDSRRVQPAAGSVTVAVTRVDLDANDPLTRSIGSFAYAGGLEIRGADFGVHELSDVRILPGDRLVAVTDRGHLFEARLQFGEGTQLTGLSDARVIPLVSEQGDPLSGDEADAEGLDILPSGDRLVSFEQSHRIWLYPADGSPPRLARSPDSPFAANDGMEALTLYPAAGPGFYLVGGQKGIVWLCSLDGSCDETAFGALVPAGFDLTALAAYGEDGEFAILARAYDPRLGTTRVSVRLIRPTAGGEGQILDELALSAPLTVDNFEGIAVVPRLPEGIRLYLLSDDNGSSSQHTYLLAFDWRPH